MCYCSGDVFLMRSFALILRCFSVIEGIALRVRLNYLPDDIPSHPFRGVQLGVYLSAAILQVVWSSILNVVTLVPFVYLADICSLPMLAASGIACAAKLRRRGKNRVLIQSGAHMRCNQGLKYCMPLGARNQLPHMISKHKQAAYKRAFISCSLLCKPCITLVRMTNRAVQKPDCTNLCLRIS